MQNTDGNDDNENNFIKFIDDLLLQYPDHVEFARQINFVFDDMKIINKQRVNYLFIVGAYLYRLQKFIRVIFIFENCISFIDPESRDDKLLKIKLDSLNYIGVSYSSLGDYHKANNYYYKSLEIAKKIRDVAGESKCYGNLGLSYYSLGDYQKAIDHHNKSLEIVKRIGDAAVESNCYAGLGIAACIELNKQEKENKNGNTKFKQKHLSTAYQNLKKSMELDEKIGLNMVEDEHKIGYYGLSANKYEAIVPVCFELEKEKEAFDFVQRGKSKAMMDLMSTSGGYQI